jgi:16S rRNA G966 N2-methylase RsmD
MPVAYTGTRDIPLHDLTRFPGNARRGNVDRIRESIRRHGQYRALVVRDTGDQLVILAGNHTHDAIRAEGHTTARCELVQCTDDEARRINLADNRLAELGQYDEDALAELLSYLDEDYEGTGYTAEDVEALITPPEQPPAVLGDPDDVPEPPAQPRSVLGDLWHLGPHRLLCGDSTNPDDLDLVLADLGAPGIIYTDPPYGISIVSAAGKVGHHTGMPFGGLKGSGKVVKTTAYRPVAGDDNPDVAADAFRLAHAAYPTACHVWWGGNHYAASAGLPDASCWLVWDKDTNGNFADAELAWTNHPGAVRLLQHMWNGMLRASERGKRVHPTQKPVALAEWAFSVVDPDKTRQVVLDVFGGSGSTLIAAYTTGRSAAVIEMEPAYVDVICRRYQQLTGTKPVHAETGETVDFTAEPANQ